MKKIAYYTCYFGGDFYTDSKLVPPIPSETEDCYFFTNNLDLYNYIQNTAWISVFMGEIPIYNNAILDTMATKEIRACPHRFEVLTNYTYLVWFDSKLQVNEDTVNTWISYLDDSDKTIIFTLHPYAGDYKTVWDEYNLSIGYEKYATQAIAYKQYIEARLAEGYSETIDAIYCGGFSIRRNCEIVHQFGEEWLRHIYLCGIQDQISLQFVVQRYAPHIKGLKYQETWKYFYDEMDTDNP